MITVWEFLAHNYSFNGAKLAKIYENNKKYGKICIISIIFRNFAVKLHNKIGT